MSISTDSISLLQQSAIVWTVGIETMKTVSAEDMNCMWQMIGFAKMQCLTEGEVIQNDYRRGKSKNQKNSDGRD